MAFDWRAQLLRTMGAPATPQNMNFLETWQKYEGGHTQNEAHFNWLNTTRDAPGAVRSINSVGVKAFAKPMQGVNALASTLGSGRYGDIVSALQSGNPYKHNLNAGLSTWVSGSPTGNLAYAQKIMGGAAPPGTAPPGAASVTTAAPQSVRTSRGPSPLLQTIQQSASERDPRAQTRAIMGALLAQREPRQIPPPPTSSSASGQPLAAAPPPGVATAGGGGINLPLNYKATHVTSGLGWGTNTASDIMGAPGTPVRAPLGGTIVTWNPTGAQGGGSMLVRYDDGREQWLGHIAGGLKPGTRFGRGQQLAFISPDHPRPHVHVDTR